MIRSFVGWVVAFVVFFGAGPAFATPSSDDVRLSSWLEGDAPRQVRLVADERVPPTHGELQAEFKELEANPVSLGLPIGLLAGGVGGAVAGYLMFVYGVVFAVMGSSSSGLRTDMSAGFSAIGIVLAAVGIAALAVGITLGIMGGIRLYRAIRARAERTRRMNEIEEQLRQPRPDATPHPPSVDLLRPRPTFVTVASF